MWCVLQHGANTILRSYYQNNSLVYMTRSLKICSLSVVWWRSILVAWKEGHTQIVKQKSEHTVENSLSKIYGLPDFRNTNFTFCGNIKWACWKKNKWLSVLKNVSDNFMNMGNYWDLTIRKQRSEYKQEALREHRPPPCLVWWSINIKMNPEPKVLHASSPYYSRLFFIFP